MGLKQSKKPANQACEPSGDLELTTSPERERTSLKRFFQSSMSTWSMGPGFADGAAAGAGVGAGWVVTGTFS